MRYLLPIAIGLLLSAIPQALAQSSGNPDEGYVYTNADLEKLGPIPTGPPPAPREREADEWRFVADFLADERARLQADRDHELEERRVGIEEQRSVGYATPYPYFPFGVYGQGYAGYEAQTPRPKRDAIPATNIPHPMFRERPPVREFVPGLGDAYRPAPPATRH